MTASIKPTFQGEVQFAGFADSSRGGPRITLRLHERADLDKFIGAEGKRYMAVLVEIGDDEQPAGTPAPTAAPQPQAPRQRMAPLCEWAVYRCGEPMFQRWASLKAKALGKSVTWPAEVDQAKPDDLAKAVILVLTGVNSRKDIDGDRQAAARFRQLVLAPYSTWLQAQEQDA